MTKRKTRKTPAKKAASKKRVTRKASGTKRPAKKATSKKKTKKKKVARKAAARTTKKAAGKTTRKKAKKTAAKTSKKPTGKTTRKKATAGKRAKAARTTRKPAARAAKKSTSTTKRKPVKRNNSATRAARRASLLSGPIHGLAPYKPRRGERYMNNRQSQHFRNILTAWQHELMEEVDRTVHHMQDEAANFPDPNDRATQESEFGLELRTRDRERKLLRKIGSALGRIDDGSYGFCSETGEEIGLKRLEARPVATLTLEAQERRELAERQFRDRDDRYR